MAGEGQSEAGGPVLRGPRVWTRIVQRTFVLDLSATLPIILIWVLMLGRACTGLLVALSLLRMLAKYLLLRREFAPLHTWLARGTQLADAELLELERELGRAPQAHAVNHLVGWLALFVLMVTLLELGVPASVDVGLAEYGMAGLLLLALLAGAGTMSIGLLRPLLLEVRADIGEELNARGLVGERLASSFVTNTILLNVPYTLAVYFGVCALSGAALVNAWRARHLADAQLRARVAADALHETGQLATGARIVGPDELPEAIHSLEHEQATYLDLPHGLDKRAGLAFAAAPTPSGWVVAQAEIDGELPWLLACIFLLPPFFLFSLARANHSMADAVARQLRELGSATRQVLDHGKLSGIERFRPADNDEAGQLLINFNELLDVLTELSSAAQRVAKGDLSVEFERSGELHDPFHTMLDQLRIMVGRMQSAATGLSAAAREIQSIATEHEELTSQQSMRVAEVGETTVQLASSATDIAISASEVLSDAERTVNTSDATLQRITALSEQASGITEVIEVIREVAERSDLLALNGALEATRAGDAGRGFMLVASEMRRLAERTAGSVSDVDALVADINRSGASSLTAMHDSRSLAQRTVQTARKISSVTEDQRRDTERVSAAMQVLAESVAATAHATIQTLIAAEGLRTHAQELEQLTERWK